MQAEEVADVAGLRFVLNHHLVPALRTVDDAVEQRRAGPGYSPTLVAVVFTVVVVDHSLNSLKTVPADVGRILVLEADLPLVHGERLLYALVWRTSPGDGSGAARDEGTRIGRVLEDGKDGRARWPAPDQVAEAITPG